MDEPFAGSTPFGIELSTDTVAAVARPRGELDMASAPQLRAVLDQLLNDGCLEVNLDMSEVGFLDCAGLNALLRASNRYREAGGRLTLSHLSPAAQRILKITSLDTVLNLA